MALPHWEPPRTSTCTSRYVGFSSEKTTVLTPRSLTFAAALLISQPCLPIYVSELKIAFSLAMAIQFGSGVFWVRACRATLAVFHKAWRSNGSLRERHIVSVLFHCRRFCWSWASSWWAKWRGNRSSWLFSSQTDTSPVPSSHHFHMHTISIYYQYVGICTYSTHAVHHNLAFTLYSNICRFSINPI